MKLETKEIYSEVYQVLILLGNEYIDKLPSSLFNMLKEKREVNYIPQYVEEVPLNKQNIKKETMSIITLLYLNYWCENENEKLEIEQILINNEDKFQEKLREKYNPDNIFKKYNQEHKETGNNIRNKTSMIPYKESIFKRITNKIKKVLYKLK